MAKIQYIADDFVKVYKKPSKSSKRFRSLVFGEKIEIIEKKKGWWKVILLEAYPCAQVGYIKGKFNTMDKGVLRFSMVDVQQGDGMVIETPEGKIVLVDGGDNKLFARHLAARFNYTNFCENKPLEVDAILVTHGDADHFDGLNQIVRSEKLPKRKKHKRIILHPKRIYHNGLLKRPGKFCKEERLGETIIGPDGRLKITELYDDTRNAPEGHANKPFKSWHKSLTHWEKRGPIEMKRIAYGMDESEVFDFLEEEGICVEIQGPFTEKVTLNDGTETDALPFLSSPPKSAALHLEHGDRKRHKPSVSHTINGHSIALRLTYGNVRINLTGDLNQEAMQTMRENLDLKDLESEIVKAPHHGSHDFDYDALEAMSPLVALVSSGDESVRKEHIHPRATLMAALGKAMRAENGILLTTELTAFFAFKDLCYERKVLGKYFADRKDKTYSGKELYKMFSGDVHFDKGSPKWFHGFSRGNFGIINARTDGERLLVYTYCGKKGMLEAYRYRVTVDDAGEHIATSEKVVIKG